ncbi:MAG: hypothetical protein ACE5KE_04490 [Methanosarcinales archaeon]
MGKEYFKRAEEFFRHGKKEYEEGLKEKDLIKAQQGCEKVFHSLVELSNAVLEEHGISIPEDHDIRAEKLIEFGMEGLYDRAKERLHNRCYYAGIIKEKLIEGVMDSIEMEIKKRS